MILSESSLVTHSTSNGKVYVSWNKNGPYSSHYEEDGRWKTTKHSSHGAALTYARVHARRLGHGKLLAKTYESEDAMKLDELRRITIANYIGKSTIDGIKHPEKAEKRKAGRALAARVIQQKHDRGKPLGESQVNELEQGPGWKKHHLLVALTDSSGSKFARHTMLRAGSNDHAMRKAKEHYSRQGLRVRGVTHVGYVTEGVDESIVHVSHTHAGVYDSMSGKALDSDAFKKHVEGNDGEFAGHTDKGVLFKFPSRGHAERFHRGLKKHDLFGDIDEMRNIDESKAKLGTGTRFKNLERKVHSGALVAYIGRKKYGEKRFEKLSHHEETQIDEVSSNLLKRYIKKANKSWDKNDRKYERGEEQLYYNPPGERADRAMDKMYDAEHEMGKREKGLAMAKSRLRGESVEVNELSHNLLRHYISKAAASAEAAAHSIHRTGGWDRKSMRTLSKRSEGISKAMPKADRGVKIENQKLEAKWKAENKEKRAAYYAKHGKENGYHHSDNWVGRVHKSDPDHESKLAALKKEHGPLSLEGRLGKNNKFAHLYKPGGPFSISKQRIRPDHATHFDVYKRSRNESVEVNEISKDLAKNYYTKASDNVESRGRRMDHIRYTMPFDAKSRKEEKGLLDLHKALHKIQSKRTRGIGMASNKIYGGARVAATEETQIDEGRMDENWSIRRMHDRGKPLGEAKSDASISHMAGSVFGARDKHGKVNVKKQRALDAEGTWGTTWNREGTHKIRVWIPSKETASREAGEKNESVVNEAEYNRDAVDKSIASSRQKISKGEGKLIHALLQGRSGVKPKVSDDFLDKKYGKGKWSRNESVNEARARPPRFIKGKYINTGPKNQPIPKHNDSEFEDDHRRVKAGKADASAMAEKWGSRGGSFLGYMKKNEAVNEAHTEQQLKNAIRSHYDASLEHGSRSLDHSKQSLRHLEAGDWEKENHHNMMSDRHDRASSRHEMAANKAESLLDKLRRRKVYSTAELKPARATPVPSIALEGVASYTRIGKSKKKTDDLSGELLTVAALKRIEAEKTKAKTT